MGKRILAFTLALFAVLFVFAGCADNSEDILGMVGQTPIYRWYYEAYLTKQLALYQKYKGIDLTAPAYRTQLKEYKAERLNELVGDAALREAARKEGLYELTAEQETEIDQQYLKYYNETVTTFLEQYGTDEKGRREAEQAYIDLLAKSSLTPERVRQTLRDNYVMGMLYKKLNQVREITDEDIRTYYDEQLQTQQESIAADPKWFGESTPIIEIVVPEGYVETVRLTLDFTSKQQTDLANAAKAVQSANQAYLLAVSQNGEGSAAASLKKDALDRAGSAFNTVLERCYTELEEQIRPIREEALAGSDFIKLMEKKSEDTHLISYFVSKDSTHVQEAYRDAALQLQNVGDVSEPVRIEGGVCIICLKDKPVPGIRPLEEVYDDIKSSMSISSNISTATGLMDEYARKAEEEGIVELYPEKL